MFELLIGFAFIGSIVASAMTPEKKPKPKPSDSMKALEALLLIAVLDKSLNDSDREKIDQVIETLKSEK